jgi:predicted AAA+ superfamily ATPase
LGGSGAAALVALLGARGAGKSQLAAAHARKCAADGFDLVAWINAETGPVPDLAKLGERLGLRARAEQTPQELPPRWSRN